MRELLNSVMRNALKLVAIGGLTALFFAMSVHAVTGSDKATVLLEGQSVRDGNVLLHGWTLTADSFWTLDVPLFAGGVLLFGVRLWLVHAVEVAIALALVAAGVVAATRNGRLRSASFAGGATVFVLLAFPTSVMQGFFLGDAFHVSTVLCALLAALAFGGEQLGWRWAIGVLLLVVAMLGDVLILAYGVVPVFLAGLVAMARRRSWRVGAPRVIAAVAAVLIAEVLHFIFSALGGFAVGPYLPLRRAGEMVTNARLLFSYSAAITGLFNHFGTGGVPKPLDCVHVICALVLVATSGIALWNLVAGITAKPARRLGSSAGAAGEHWHLDDVLLLGALGAAASFIALAVPGLSSARYIVPGVLLASVLAGRVVARMWPLIPRRLSFWVALASVCVALCLGACAGFLVTASKRSSPQQALAAWLSDRGLHSGIGDYWSASATTVASDGDVVVRPVSADPAGVLQRRVGNSTTSWYEGQRFQFLVYNTAPIWEGVNTASAARTFGRPSHVYVFGTYRILVWRYDVAVAGG
jgi:hypothetical protein